LKQDLSQGSQSSFSKWWKKLDAWHLTMHLPSSYENSVAPFGKLSSGGQVRQFSGPSPLQVKQEMSQILQVLDFGSEYCLGQASVKQVKQAWFSALVM
jgi:hypothetical protein